MKTPSKESVIINVCIIPNDEVEAKCIELSQSLKSNNTMFVLDGKTKFAHMTLYMARFANSEVQNIIDSTKQSLKELKSFMCDHAGYFMTPGRYFEASYRRTDQLRNLHERLVEALKDYRLNPGRPFEEGYFTPYTDEQRKNAEETGYDLAYELFRPHITLTRYYEGKMLKQNPEIPPVDLSFPLQKICIYKADNNGAAYEQLAELNL